VRLPDVAINPPVLPNGLQQLPVTAAACRRLPRSAHLLLSYPRTRRKHRLDVWPFMVLYAAWAIWVLDQLFTHGWEKWFVVQLGTYTLLALHVSSRESRVGPGWGGPWDFSCDWSCGASNWSRELRRCAVCSRVLCMECWAAAHMSRFGGGRASAAAAHTSTPCPHAGHLHLPACPPASPPRRPWPTLALCGAST